MAQFRTLSADDVRGILAAFSIAGYRAHQPIAVGTINTNLRVETADGPLFLRINEGKSEDDVLARGGHRGARGRARRADAGPARHQRRRRVRALARTRFVSLFPWVAGPHAGAGGADARPRRRRRGRRSPSCTMRATAFRIIGPGRYEPPEIDARLARIAALGRPELAPAVAVLVAGARATCPGTDARTSRSGIIHGDLFVDNVLYDDAGALTALIDFEQASWGRLAYDLAVTTLAFGYGRDDFRPEIVRALVDAYAAARPVTDAERAAFGAELRFVACRFAVTRITDVHLKRDAGAAPGKNYQRYLDRLASVKKHLAAKDGLFDL